MKRHTAAERIATHLWTDIADVREGRYHYGRTSCPVYTYGNNYYCSPSTGKPPGDWEWELVGTEFGKGVYRA
jgi:hypothetical protein